jgi:hypothetical protein
MKNNDSNKVNVYAKNKLLLGSFKICYKNIYFCVYKLLFPQFCKIVNKFLAILFGLLPIKSKISYNKT